MCRWMNEEEFGGVDGHSHENRGTCAWPLRTRGGLNVEKEGRPHIHALCTSISACSDWGSTYRIYGVDHDHCLPTRYMHLQLSMPLETGPAVSYYQVETTHQTSEISSRPRRRLESVSTDCWCCSEGG